LWLVTWGGLCLPCVLLAQNFTRDSYRDVRFLGRGGAGIADVRGGAAAFYNPAGLATSQNFSFVPLEASLGFNKNIYTSFAEISTLTSSGETLSEKFSPLLGKPLALQGSFFPHLSARGLMLGFYDYMDVNIEYRDPVFPRLDLAARNDWGLVAGFGIPLAPNFHIGASIRYMRRRNIEEVLNMASVFNLTGSYLLEIMEKGEAWGLNVGALFRQDLNSRLWLSAGFAVEDVGYTQFKNANRGPLPNRQAQKMNTGFAAGLKIPAGEAKLLFDIKELNDLEKSYTKKIYTGGELLLPLLTLRGGFYQGYWTTGISTYVLPGLELDLVTYGEELDSAAGLREARYWMLGLRTSLDMKKKSSGRKQRFTLDHL
jgi:hypothetical protein